MRYACISPRALSGRTLSRVIAIPPRLHFASLVCVCDVIDPKQAEWRPTRRERDINTAVRGVYGSGLDPGRSCLADSGRADLRHAWCKLSVRTFCLFTSVSKFWRHGSGRMRGVILVIVGALGLRESLRPEGRLGLSTILDADGRGKSRRGVSAFSACEEANFLRSRDAHTFLTLTNRC